MIAAAAITAFVFKCMSSPRDIFWMVPLMGMAQFTVFVGYAIYFSTFSSFVGRPGLWLEDLYVRPRFRKRGIGRRLIEAVAGVAARRNCGRNGRTQA